MIKFKFLKTWKFRLFIVFIIPLFYTSYVGYHKIDIPEDGLVDKVIIDNEEIIKFFSSIFNIPLEKVRRDICLYNRNIAYQNIKPIYIDNIDYSELAAMGVYLSSVSTTSSLLYAKVGDPVDCKNIDEEKLVSGRITVEFKHIMTGIVTEDLAEKINHQASQKINHSSTKLYLRVSNKDFLLIFVASLIAWCTLIVLFREIRYFVLRGLDQKDNNTIDAPICYNLPMQNSLKGFLDFIRKQGVIGFAVAFILGAAVTKVVSSAVTDLVNPILGLILGSTEGLKGAFFQIAGAKIMYGNFLSNVLDFVIVAAVVYFGIKMIGLEKLDKKD